MKEIWKSINGYESYYQISNLGRVYSNRNKRMMKNSSQKSGHLICGLCVNGKQKLFYIHQLVARAFIENPNNYKVVHHQDNNPKNNKVDNLIWCTKRQNNLLAWEDGRTTGRNKTPVSEKQLKEIGRLLLEKKVSTKKIGELFNIPSGIIREINHEFKKVDDRFKRSASKLGRKERNEIKNLLIENKLRQHEIAALFSISQPKVCQLRKEFNL